MSTPDAAPVEVEGEAVPLAEDLDLPVHWSVMEKVAYRSGWADCRLRALRALPAAPTTPDIADERMRRALVAINDLVRGHDDDPCEGCLNDQACEIGEVLNILDALGPAALATPSTPGAGQADPRNVSYRVVKVHDGGKIREPRLMNIRTEAHAWVAVDEYVADEGGEFAVDRVTTQPIEAPEPATGQGEPS